jgi:cytochrome c biogenesis protein CcdA
VIQDLVARIPDAALLAPLLGFVVGALLSVSPVALPSLPVVMSAVAPTARASTAADPDRSHRQALLRAAPAVFAFVAGMDGMLGLAAMTIVELAELLTRAAVALHLVSAVLLTVAGLRLLLRRTSLCRRAGALPPAPSEAFGFGMAFAVTGCPACGPIAIGVGTAAAAAAGPGPALGVVIAFLAGRSVTLLAAAAAAARLAPAPGAAPALWRRLDVAVGALFLTGAGYYLFRLLSGAVTTALPGEPGGPLP